MGKSDALHIDDEGPEYGTPHTVTHADALQALQAAGFRASLVNTGGGCMAYEVPLEGGFYVLVTGADVFGPVRVYGDGAASMATVLSQ